MEYAIYNEDCFVTLGRLNEHSVDMVMVDVPYGTTACKWDSIIPLEPMWEALKRVVKKNGAMVFTASQPFTSTLVVSNQKAFKYCWCWDKVNRFSGFLNAKKQPLRNTEDICVFYLKQPIYNPQMTKGKPFSTTHGVGKTGRGSENYGTQVVTKTVNNGTRYPTQLLSIKADRRGTEGRIHPTQKPVALMEYLIKTYTNEGGGVLDFAMGSGTTGVACGNLGRKFVGCDNDTEHGYFEIAEKRIKEAYNTNIKKKE